MGHRLIRHAQKYMHVRLRMYAARFFCLFGKGYRHALSAVLLVCFVTTQCLFPSFAHAFGEFTIKDELELGKKFNILIRSRMPLVQDPEIVNYVKGIVGRLEKTMPPQPFPFTPSVIRHNAVNAFAIPGGYIFIHTGLILAVNHESELAGVVAHEMAHVTQRHIAGRIQQAQWVSILSILGAVAGAFMGGEATPAMMAGSMAAGQAAMLKYSRGDENEADQVGMNYLTRAKFNPEGMVGAFKILGKKQWNMGSTVPPYLSTHPGINERADDMELRIKRLPASARTAPEKDDQFLRVQTLIRARYSDPDVASQFFAKQLSTPHRALALLGQGMLASRQNRVNNASAAFAEALSLQPADPLFIREAGQFHYTKGDHAKGEELLRKAVLLNDSDILALFYYANCLADNGNTATAIDYTRRVLRAVPEDAEVHEYLARLYGTNRQLFKANLHMAWAALYSNNKRKVAQFLPKAKNLAKTVEEKNQIERFDAEYLARRDFWS